MVQTKGKVEGEIKRGLETRPSGMKCGDTTIQTVMCSCKKKGQSVRENDFDFMSQCMLGA